MAIELCLFDLDNTLLHTNDLESFRGRENVGITSTTYTQKLLNSAFGTESPNRYLYKAEHLSALREKFPEMRWGIFTRSPHHYAQTLLTHAYPDFEWNIIIGREDIDTTKPYPYGVWKAGMETGVKTMHNIALVGDEKVDVVCAYRAGCWSFIDQTSWTTIAGEHWWALERVPDALFKGAEELAKLLETPYLRVPELEYLISDQNLEGRKIRIDKINHFFPRIFENGYVPINVMGRLFGEYEELSPRRNWHTLTEQIHLYKNATKFPETWVRSIHDFIDSECGESGEIVVTVIPFKPGRVPRLEALLEQVSNSHTPHKIRTIKFIADVLGFHDGAVSSHGFHLSLQERFENIRTNLYIKRPEEVLDKRIIIIDDVVTTGATLLWAHFYLKQAGAIAVNCVSLAKAIGAN